MTFEELEKKLNYSFKNKKLLEKALIHRSYSIERRLKDSNEKLELLGDSVIGLLVLEYLLEKFKHGDEGYLSKLKSHIVSSKNLYRWAKKISLENHIKLSFAEEKSGGRQKFQIIANAFEAVIGAVYIDGGLNAARQIINMFLGNEKNIEFEDYKSILQELCQKRFKTIPQYQVISQEGPDHRKKFTVSLTINNKNISTGTGHSKKEAEMNAAKKALEIIKGGHL